MLRRQFFEFMALGFTMSIVLAAGPAAAQSSRATTAVREFVTLSSGTKIWVEADMIDPRFPTMLIFNGLTNSATESFSDLSKELLALGNNVIRFDFRGQAKTLRENRKTPDVITFQEQVADVKDLVPRLKERLSLRGPLNVFGQSYGGGIILATLGLEPVFAKQNFASVTVFAPYTEPLRTQDEQILTEVGRWKRLIPFLSRRFSDAELYDMVFDRIVYSTYWSAEPEINSVTLFGTLLNLKGVSAMAKGIRGLVAEKLISAMPDLPINVVAAVGDQYIPNDVIPAFWAKMQQRIKGVFVWVYQSEHKILQVVPSFSAKLVELLSRKNNLVRGSTLEAFALSGSIYARDVMRGGEPQVLSDLLGQSQHPSSVIECRKVWTGMIR